MSNKIMSEYKINERIREKEKEGKNIRLSQELC